MSSRIGHHLRGNVVGYIALFFALGLGSAWALDRDSVKSTHIVNDQVKSADVRDDALNGGGLTGVDIREDTLGEVPQASSADNAQAAEQADNAGLLDNLDSSAFLRANAKAADADKLDNQDSTAFVRGTDAKISSGRADFPAPGMAAIVRAVYFGEVQLHCSTGPDSFFLSFGNNESFFPFDAYLDDGSGDPSFQRVGPGESSASPTKTLTGDLAFERVVWQLVGDGGGIATITASARMQDTIDGPICHGAAQVVYSGGAL